jgi:thymidylate kinase
MELICITGIDGAGKSTLAKNLVSNLKEDGRKACYVYGRTVPLLSRALMYFGRLLLIRKQSPWNDYSLYSTKKKSVMKNPLLRFFYTLSIWSDYYVQIWLKLFPRLFGNQVVIVDRYVYDTIISDLTVHLGYTEEDTLRIIESSMRFLPRPGLALLVDLSEELAFSRKTDIPDVDYLRERRPFYQALVTRPEVHVIDGALPLESILSVAVAAASSGLGKSK